MKKTNCTRITRSLWIVARFFGKLVILEMALLVVVTIVWRLTNWHTDTSYAYALVTAGEILSGLGLMGLAGRGGSDDKKILEGEVEMRSWDHLHGDQLLSKYWETTLTASWLIFLGLATLGIGLVLARFFP